LQAPEDYFHAAMVFQHGETLDDFWRAHELAKRGAELGHPNCRWLTAAAYDRWLMNQGKPQKYGTQYTSRDEAHHRFLIGEQLAHIDALDEEIAHLSTEIAQRLRPFEPQLKGLETIPGIKRRLAEVILAEIGPEMSRFPNARHRSRNDSFAA
jgi:transposase